MRRRFNLIPSRSGRMICARGLIRRGRGRCLRVCTKTTRSTAPAGNAPGRNSRRNRQISEQESLLINQPPYQRGQDRGDDQRAPPGAQRDRAAEQHDPSRDVHRVAHPGVGTGRYDRLVCGWLGNMDIGPSKRSCFGLSARYCCFSQNDSRPCDAEPPITQGMPTATCPSAAAETQPSATAPTPTWPQKSRLRRESEPLVLSSSTAASASLRTAPSWTVSAASTTSVKGALTASGWVASSLRRNSRSSASRTA